MNKPATHNTQPAMSLLSAYMSSGADKPNKLMPIRRLASRQESGVGQGQPSAENNESPEGEEPPDSLYYSNSVVEPRLVGVNNLRNNGVGRPVTASSSLSVMPDLAASPLTSCSFQTLSKVYDMDTWRMYERIKTSRARSEEDLFSLVQQTVDRIIYDQEGDDLYPQNMDFPANTDSAHAPEMDDIFELEL